MATILIVDDEPQVREAVRRSLERRGHRVAEAANVASARHLVADVAVDLVLADINMPGESGIELVRHIAANSPGTAVIMMTAIDDPGIAEEALALGASGYLVKPFHPNEVVIAVASGLRRRDLELARHHHINELETKLVGRTTALRQALQRLETTETTAHLAERETVDRLAMALTLRSEETGGHIERMSRYAAVLSRRLETPLWSDDEIRLASMLHDVGKIGVPDSILLKPGPLTDDEFEVIKRHPALGQALLSDGHSQVLILGAQIALTHHERWDGTGYPSGLAADNIPLAGRIAAIADVFDALTSDRVYRAALPIEHAIQVMLDQRGRHFDPDLLDLLLASTEELGVIRSKYPDPPAS
jgi:putative two-component system response regulator